VPSPLRRPVLQTSIASCSRAPLVFLLGTQTPAARPPPVFLRHGGAEVHRGVRQARHRGVQEVQGQNPKGGGAHREGGAQPLQRVCGRDEGVVSREVHLREAGEGESHHQEDRGHHGPGWLGGAGGPRQRHH